MEGARARCAAYSTSYAVSYRPPVTTCQPWGAAAMRSCHPWKVLRACGAAGLHRQCLFGGLRIGLYEPVRQPAASAQHSIHSAATVQLASSTSSPCGSCMSCNPAVRTVGPYTDHRVRRPSPGPMMPRCVSRPRPLCLSTAFNPRSATSTWARTTRGRRPCTSR